MKMMLALVAALAVLGAANAQVLENECPPKSGDVYTLGYLGGLTSWRAAWLAAEHAVNGNALAAKPSVGCFDFDITFFSGDGVADVDNMYC